MSMNPEVRAGYKSLLASLKKEAEQFSIPIPLIEDIHQRVYEAATSSIDALDMGSWHCGTSHCRAGWVVVLAGQEGVALERRFGTGSAARLIYGESDRHGLVEEDPPDFGCSNNAARSSMKCLADAERQLNEAEKG